jgi:quinol monooxygenase YgiN
MLIVTAAARLRPERREEALAAARQMQEATTAERGCHEYRFWIAIDDPNSVLVFERWVNLACLQAHLSAPHVADFNTAISRYADGPVTVSRFEVADSP